ncbi:hypothetical protein PO909_021633 [Leuciscus waleckii]
MATAQLYCVCRQPYDVSRFMIECDICKDWFHGSRGRAFKSPSYTNMGIWFRLLKGQVPFDVYSVELKVCLCVCRRRKIDEGPTAQRQVQSPIHQRPSEVENTEGR